MNAPCHKTGKTQITARLAFKKMNKFGLPCYDNRTMRWYRMSQESNANVKVGNLEVWSDKQQKFVPKNFNWETIVETGEWFCGDYKKDKKPKPAKNHNVNITLQTVHKFLAKANQCLNGIIEYKIKDTNKTETN